MPDDSTYTKAFLIDMDGVINKGATLIPGAREFLQRLRDGGHPYLFITNNSYYTPAELRDRLGRIGIDEDEKRFYTSAMATATFLEYQMPRCTAYVIGGNGLIHELEKRGIAITDKNPDYVIVGETKSYSFEKMTRAVHCVLQGARLIGTNPDLTDRFEEGIVPATQALVAPIELVTGKKAYYIGKPNPLMMRHALKQIGCSREETLVIGDRMDTDIVAGIEAGIDTLLVLSGVTSRAEMDRFPYRPAFVLDGVGDIVGMPPAAA